MIELFNDQEQIINKLRDEMRKSKRILLQAETGFGKSVCASYMIQMSINKGFKSAFVVPRKELLRQMGETFDKFGINYSYVASGKPFNPYAKVHLCTIGTLANRINNINPDLIFKDESHYGAGQLDKINTHFTALGKWIIGLTATPENNHLHKWYDTMICGPTIKELISMNRLSDFRYFAPSSPDLSSIKKVGGEYSRGQLEDYMMERRVLVGDAVRHYKENAFGRLNMTFCTSIKHSQMTAETFNSAGIPSMHMDAETPENERKIIAKAFAGREILNLCTVDLCLFGYDLSSASGVSGVAVESMSDLRPTLSRNTQRQKIGRVLRYKDYPALIFDHASNYIKHGLPDQDVEWSLQPKEKKKGHKEPTPPTRQCDNCFFIHSPAPSCPECGTVYEIRSREVDEIDGELVELDHDTQIKEKKKEQGRAESLDDLIELGKRRGMKYPAKWAAHVLSARMAKAVRR